MPHSTHRGKKSPIAQKKSKNVELDDGWTLVTRGASTFSTTSTTTKSADSAEGREEAQSSDDDHAVTPSDQEVTALQQRLVRLQERWQAMPYRLKVTDLLERRRENKSSEEHGHRNASVDNAVCVAIGSFSNDVHGAGQTSMRSLWQLVLFLEVVNVLYGKTKQERSVKVCAQEPRFTALDKRFLERLGIAVLEAPRAVDHITSSCFLFAPFLEWNILLSDVLKGKDPLLYIGTNVHYVLDRFGTSGRAIGKEGRSREEFTEMEDIWTRFSQSRERVDLPDEGKFDGHANAFYGLTTYFRRE